MGVEYVKVVERDQPVLLASLSSLGLQEQWFEQATGWSYGVDEHRYASRRHCISKQDFARLSETITERAGSGPEFWSDYVRRCAAGASLLLETARSLVGLAGGGPGTRDLAEGFATFATAVKGMASFLVATPAVRDALEAVVVRTIGEEMAGADAEARAAGILPRLLDGRQESEAVREVRSGYRLALEIGGLDEAKELVTNRAPMIALIQLEGQFPALRELIQHHVDEYGWIRTQGGHGLEPTSPKELIQRLQMMLLRWKPEAIRKAAEPPPIPDVGTVLGFAPSESLGVLIGALQDMADLRCFRAGIHLQAACIVRPFLARVAAALGCTQEQLMFAAVQEVSEALGGGVALPIAEIDDRMRSGFAVERSGGDLRVQSGVSLSVEQQAPSVTVTGQSVSVGRAVGRVRHVFEPGDILELRFGDVLVTGPSTPDKMGTESAFPTREGAPPGMEWVAAIVADEGGLLSHAATISRELGIPCVVGTEHATSTLIDGQIVEVDATREAGRVIVFESP